MKWLSRLVDKASDYFAHRKGLLPLIGMALVVINFILPFLLGLNWVTGSNLFLQNVWLGGGPKKDESSGTYSPRAGT